LRLPELPVRPAVLSLLAVVTVIIAYPSAASPPAAAPTAQVVSNQIPERPDVTVERGVYTELEASSDGTAYVIVMLQPVQAARGTPQQRRAAVRDIQNRVLANLPPGEFTPVYQYENFAAMTGRVNAPGLAKLAADPDVVGVGPDGRGHAHLDVSVPFINADDAHALGYTGTGITVAVLDTGIDSDHPDLSDNIATGWYHFLDQGATTGVGAEDNNGHGTNVSGIITSKGQVASVGVAPDADILAIKVLKADGSGWVSDWASGVDYVVSHKDDYDKLCCINMSLGTWDLYGSCPCDNADMWTMLMQASVQAAKSAGIASFASSGNQGSTTSMSCPACLSTATAVAAVYDQNLGREPNTGTYQDMWSSFGNCYDGTTAPDKIACFSNRSTCNELAAPGRLINAPAMGGGTGAYTGTSQASPHVAGVAALMCQKCVDRGESLTPNAMVQAMKSTGVSTNDPASTTPNPIRVDALGAVNEVCEGAEAKWSQPPHGPEEGFDEASDFWWTEVQPQANGGTVAGTDDGADSSRGRSKAQVSLAAGKVAESPMRGEIRVVQAIPRDGSAPVVANASRQGTTVYENTEALSPVYWVAPGGQGYSLLADDITLAGSERKLTSYDIDVWLPSPYCDVGMQLYTDVGGYPGTAIPATDFGLGFMMTGRQTLTADAYTDIILPDKIWLVVEFSCSDTGWIIAEEAELGCTDDVLALYDGTWHFGTVTEHYAGFWAHVKCEETDELEVNKVVADDFESDGRPVDAIRWWGSYIEDLYEPIYWDPPYVLDGWFISFHHDDVINPGCPPGVDVCDPHPTVLGVYYAPIWAVEWYKLQHWDCLGHPVYEYKVDLRDCCLLCSEQDPRSGHYPVEDDAFTEEAGFWYWLDIQAVTGVTWDPPYCAYGDRVLTGNVPPTWTQDGHFWGWHTSFVNNRYEACTGRIYDLPRYPPECWDYGDWDVTYWKCPTPVETVDMAFELLTTSGTTGPDPPEKPDGEAGYDKNRYISFLPANPGELTALRVTLTTLPPVFAASQGSQVWVGEPVEICENSGQSTPPPGGCGPAWVPGGPALTMWSTNLQATQYCHDFGSVGLLHVTDCEIVPNATYNVQAIACTADPGNEENYSDPLTINTSMWGDICHTYDGTHWTAPNGTIDVTLDVTACLEKFKNSFGAPIKARADVDPNTPEWKVNVSTDVTRILDAFKGYAYPFAGPGTCPP